MLRLKPKTFLGIQRRNWSSADLCIDLSHYSAGCSFPKHGHVSPFFCFVLNGTCEEHFDGSREGLRPGSLVYHPAGFEHSNHWHEAGRCLLPLSRDTFFYADPDINPQRNRRITFVKDEQGHVKELIYKVDGKKAFKAPYLGPLIRTLTPQPDADQELTKKVAAVLRAFGQGGKAIEEAANITPGFRKDCASLKVSEFAGIKTISFIFAQDAVDRGMERHGGKVNRILYYKIVTDKATHCVLVYMTGEGLITDEDVVDE